MDSETPELLMDAASFLAKSADICLSLLRDGDLEAGLKIDLQLKLSEINAGVIALTRLSKRAKVIIDA